jgi:hypothetical protein
MYTLKRKINFNSINKFSKYFFGKKLSVPLPHKDLSLKEADSELYDLVQKEQKRQWIGLELIASENYTSKAVMECLGNYIIIKYI